MGAESNNDFSSGDDIRFQTSLKYSFSSKDFYHISGNPEK